MKRIADFANPAAVRRTLECRSVKDKIAIAIDCDVAPTDSLPAVTELVASGIIEWIDRAMLPMLAVQDDGSVRAGLNCDIYRLTADGVALCDLEGIQGH